MKAKIWNLSGWVEETDPEGLLKLFEPLLKAAGFSVLHIAYEHFQPHGYTALFLLGESHLAIHTFPEEETTYFELSSCVEQPFRKFAWLFYTP